MVALIASAILVLVSVQPALAAPGELDSTFSGDGRQLTDFAGANDTGEDVVRQADGKLVSVGQSGPDFALARYNPNGALDTTFSGDGRQVVDFGDTDAARAVTLQPDGRIIAVGETFGSTTGKFSVARLKSNGVLDNTFSGDGRTTIEFNDRSGALSVVVQRDGRIAVAGSTGNFGAAPSGANFAAARLTAEGNLDSTFSGDGRQIVDFGAGDDTANGLVQQADGKLVAGGSVEPTPNSRDFGAARFKANGALDTSFSGDGRTTTDFGGGEFAGGAALQPDGKLVLAGTTRTGCGRHDLQLRRGSLLPERRPRRHLLR